MIKPEQLKNHESEIGAKALRLADLKKAGFNVPDFLVLPAKLIKNIANQKGIEGGALSVAAEEARQNLNARQYAVRSSALIEDGSRHSYAGQFLTKVAVNPHELEKSMAEVIMWAFKYLHGEMDKFSLIVQRYVEADISGVAFTRSPLGGREMVVEYLRGRGGKLVGGEMAPTRLSLYWNSEIDKDGGISMAEIEKFKEIEGLFAFPQDIEWCMKGGEFFILQARPISSLGAKDFEQAKYLDEALKNREPFYYKKTEISEIAPRPKPLMLGLLRSIYRDGGPVQAVYRKYGVRYIADDFLEIIGNELYVDKEKELRSFFPAKTYFGSQPLAEEFARLDGLWTSFKNTLALGKIRNDDFATLIDALKARLNANPAGDDLRAWKENFLKDYETVFEANLLAGLALQRLKLKLADRDDIGMASWFAFGKKLIAGLGKDLEIGFVAKDLVGNSIDVADGSKFEKNIRASSADAGMAEAWLDKLPRGEKEQIRMQVMDMAAFGYAREYGRWLTVLRINKLREILFAIAGRSGIEKREDMYFAELEDLVAGKIDQERIKKAKAEYEKFASFELPATISSYMWPEKNEKPLGVSSGKAMGKLADAAQIDPAQRNILYTRILSPDLVQHFDKIAGIVSENGGMLSHLAIMARERNIPVVVNFSLNKEKIKIGDYIAIDGDKGTIDKQAM